jgi:hypothetical protein
MKPQAGRVCLAALVLFGCSSAPDPAETGEAKEQASAYVSEVLSFEPGEEAGFGADKLPGVVLGPPKGKGLTAGSLDVLSLGKGGSIELAFGGELLDGDGPDFIVFENAFWPGGDATAVFAELGEVSVSENGVDWVTFPCDSSGDAAGSFPGCAGFTPTLEYDAETMLPLEPALTGGDAFDLAEIGLSRARFVRVRDVSNAGAAPSAGFDLDAVGVVQRDVR